MVHAVTTKIARSKRFGSVLSGGCVALAGLLSQAVALAADPVTLAVIPAPAKVERLDGDFVVTSRTRISSEDTAEGLSVAAYFADLVRRSHGWSLPIERAAETTGAAPRIAFRVGEDVDTSSPEAYVVSVAPESVTVSARDRRGLLYGAATLWQLMEAGSTGRAAVPAMRIDDAPRFAWR